ncbi:neocarzinostatin apoprotein domain-containing protein [Streptomyces sp. NPDC002886]|uniref:neocarzinostatin apoprotein domain-containing protein n=1 Tax=Streptomyces sp. NPDC002886 TaxID=3364667 RepID=UPI0036BA2EBA
MTSRRRSRCAGALAAAAALVAVSAAPSAAAGTLTVSKSSGLTVGEKVTVSATGLSPNQGFVPIGLCKPKPTGPADCETSPDSAVIGKTDASGVWHSAANGAATAQITVKATAGAANCAAKPGNCVIAVSISATKELVEVKLTVGSSGGPSPSSAPPTASASASASAASGGGSATGSGGNAAGSLPRTGSTDGMPVAALSGSTLFLFGGCALVLLRRGRRV